MKSGTVETSLHIEAKGGTVATSSKLVGRWDLPNPAHGDTSYVIDDRDSGYIQGQGVVPRLDFMRYVYIPRFYVPNIVGATDEAQITAVTYLHAKTEHGETYYRWQIVSEWFQDPPRVAQPYSDKRFLISLQSLPDGPISIMEQGCWHGMDTETNPARILMQKHWLWVRRVFG
jgi:hypothetical protein